MCRSTRCLCLLCASCARFPCVRTRKNPEILIKGDGQWKRYRCSSGQTTCEGIIEFISSTRHHSRSPWNSAQQMMKPTHVTCNLMGFLLLLSSRFIEGTLESITKFLSFLCFALPFLVKLLGEIRRGYSWTENTAFVILDDWFINSQRDEVRERKVENKF